MIYLVNAFSINMLDRKAHKIEFTPITPDQAATILNSCNWESAIGHKDKNLEQFLENLLGTKPAVDRTTIKIDEKDLLIVAQYSGERLPEGATSLPAGAKIEFWLVQIFPE